MSPRPSEHALVDRIGAAFATLVFGVQIHVLAETGHAMPGIPILAVLATPFAALHDGRRIAIWGIQGPNAASRRDDVAAERLIAAMNAELERRRSPAVEPEFEAAELEAQYLVA